MKIIDGIKEICFNFDCNNERRFIHRNTLNEIKNFLENCNFITQLEYPIIFDYKTTKGDTIFMKNGFIDLVAESNQIKIAIELDSGNHLKYKSIEKLLKTNFDILIGIVKGNSGSPELIQENIDRIKSKMNLNSKQIILIVMIDNSITYVNNT